METLFAPLFANGNNWALMGAGSSIVLAGLGSLLGTAIVASKGAGVLSEKPGAFGKLLPLVALPGSSVIYGFLIALFIQQKLGAELGQAEGVQLMMAGLIMGFAGLFTGWQQGKAAAAGAGAVGRDEKAFIGALVFAALLETAAIFALLLSIFLLNS